LLREFGVVFARGVVSQFLSPDHGPFTLQASYCSSPQCLGTLHSDVLKVFTHACLLCRHMHVQASVQVIVHKQSCSGDVRRSASAGHFSRSSCVNMAVSRGSLHCQGGIHRRNPPACCHWSGASLLAGVQLVWFGMHSLHRAECGHCLR
jgi:hypothetical protein